MPLSVVPTRENEPTEPSGLPPREPEQSPQTETAPRSDGNGTAVRGGAEVRSTSRWVDYDTHELLEMISELEDERRWARLREGILWAVVLHGLLLVALIVLPRYIVVPRVIQPQITAKDHEWTYLDSPRIPVRPPTPKTQLNTPKPPVIDKKTPAANWVHA